MHAYDQMTEPELHAHFRTIASELSKMLPDNTGFILLAAPMGADGVAQFVSNVEPESSASWMRETLARRGAGDVVERGG